MSRCFPFPPPGYEKKPQSDHVDLLIKKHKEKKHKKEKRDKDKREGKERKDRDKDRDRSKDKHRDKKDKKEKHRDKDKKNDKDRVKDEKRILYERKDGEHTVGRNDKKLGGEGHLAKDLKDARFMEELGGRIRDEERGPVNQMVQRRFEDVGSSSQKERTTGTEIVHGISIPEQKRMRVAGAMEKERSTGTEIVHGISIPEQKRMGVAGAMEKEKSTGTEILHGISIPEQKRMGVAGAMEKERSTGTEIVHGISIPEQKRMGVAGAMEKEKSTGTEIVHGISIPEQKRMGMAGAMEQRVTGSEMAQNLSTEQRRPNGMDIPTNKDANKKIEGKEKAKELEVDGKKGDRHKDKDRERKHKSKDKARNKEKEKEEKIKEKGKQKHKEQDKLRDCEKKEQVATHNVSSSFSPKDNVKSAGADGCLKRKEANGFLHENEVRPSKLPRPSSSFQFSLENGSQSSQSPICNLHASDRHESLNAVDVEKILDSMEHKINGIIDFHSASNILRPPLIAEATENGEISEKSPHPDEKHLSQILHVPQMEEWPEFDDQEWLLSRDDLRQKPKTKLEAEETPKVWAEAVRIESADVLVLPYVIPY